MKISNFWLCCENMTKNMTNSEVRRLGSALTCSFRLVNCYTGSDHAQLDPCMFYLSLCLFQSFSFVVGYDNKNNNKWENQNPLRYLMDIPGHF